MITLTLARLYESQNHVFEALLMYQFLQIERNESFIKAKIEELTKKIWQENTITYHTSVNNIFSEDDKIKFQIYPSKIYSKLKKIEATIFDINSPVKMEEITSNDEEGLSQNEILQLFKNMEKIDIQAIIQSLQNDNKPLENITLQELYQTINKLHEK
jgi:hypothetical protein